METEEFLKTLLENQERNYQLLFTILIAITTVLAGSSWLWNLFIAKRQIRAEVSEETKLLTKLYETKEAELKDDLDKKLKKEIEKQFADIQFEISRLFGIIAEDKELLDSSVRWWCESLDHAIKSQSEYGIRIATNQLKRLVENEEFKEYDEDELDLNYLNEVIDKIPATLYEEKRIINKEIKKLKKKE